ncbi:MAG: YggS family pyridoxal phosphate-dependent enzyme [Planctomycetaceae bacterium]
MISEIIERNLAAVFSDIAAACERSGRRAQDVRLVAVTKYARPEWISALAEFHTVFGENRPQQLCERFEWLPQIQWHLIGQLQRNKVKMVLPAAAMIHSVDSLRLLHRIDDVARELQLKPQILLQVNVTGEASKSGFTPEQLTSQWAELVTLCASVHPAGLMTMAAESADPDDARPAFHSLAEILQELNARQESRDAGIHLTELSMGMSGDFVPAVECGATLVRIGSLLFEGLSEDS